ncbi:hypothetical protein RRG08_066202 [Elysia crispata]|uniref:Uncharacterized protein n=1 Tax=Elysia crispata TaxID=231223 RepID=A0AAE1D4R6_9GAST|nr:hypothetical protein RRG08_066202 [Elysia crispata]
MCLGFDFCITIYSGKDDRTAYTRNVIPEDSHHLSISEQIVVYVTYSLLNKGYAFMDNWYSNVRLYLYLFEKRTLACGTIHHGRDKCSISEGSSYVALFFPNASQRQSLELSVDLSFVLRYSIFTYDTSESADEKPGPSGDAAFWMNIVDPDSGPPVLEFTATPGPKINIPVDS